MSEREFALFVLLISFIVITAIFGIMRVNIECGHSHNKPTGNNKRLNSYPCNYYLHNALDFMEQGKIDSAYIEICCAITRSGGALTEYESKEYKRRWNK